MKKFPSLIIWLGIILLIMTTGVAGFMTIEHYSFIDALYMTVITLATIGYREVNPLSTAGKIFNIIFIISSFAFFAYAISRLTFFIISGDVIEYFKNRKQMHEISRFTKHVIICGFGRNGQQAAEILRNHHTDFVVVDNDENHFKEWMEDHGQLVSILGDATDDAVLQKAGIEKARALLLTLPTDADNVFIVLSARSMNAQLQIISRATFKSSVNKLKKAGADHVILPDKIGGAHMATLISKPDVIEFINAFWEDQSDSGNIESVDYSELPSIMKGKSIADIISSGKTGVNCIGIKNKEGRYAVNPQQHTIIQEHMKLILLGSAEQIAGFKQHLKEMK